MSDEAVDLDKLFHDWQELSDRARRSLRVCKVAVDGQASTEEAIRWSRWLVRVALKMKGVACPSCDIEGQRMYSNDSTWRRGVGKIGRYWDVCDRCWGTMRTDKPGTDLRKLLEEKR
jgi:hypothetical protein